MVLDVKISLLSIELRDLEDELDLQLHEFHIAHMLFQNLTGKENILMMQLHECQVDVCVSENSPIMVTTHCS